MKRREALVAAGDLVGEAFPVVSRRDDSSFGHVVGVTIDGLPCLQFSCIAIGRTREEEEVHLQLRIAGTSDEVVPLFVDSPGQPEPLFDGPLLHRQGSEHVWRRDRDELRQQISVASRARWDDWRVEAARVFAAAPAAWADACERVATLEQPRRWMAIDVERRAAALSGLVLPVRAAWEGAVWTAAWIGLGPVLDEMVKEGTTPALVRIASAARMIRASRADAGHA